MNQIDVQSFILIGTLVLILLALVWFLGLRRQLTSHPRPRSAGYAEPEVRAAPSGHDDSERRDRPDIAAPAYRAANGAHPVTPIVLPERVSVPVSQHRGPLDARNGERSQTVTLGTRPVASSLRAANAAKPVRLREEEVEGVRSQWSAIQSRFVDEPRESVEEADQLVSETITHVETLLAAERTILQRQLESPDEPSTDELRSALRGYRSLLERLLAA